MPGVKRNDDDTINVNQNRKLTPPPRCRYPPRRAIFCHHPLECFMKTVFFWSVGATPLVAIPLFAAITAEVTAPISNARVYPARKTTRMEYPGREFDLPVDADAVDRHLVFMLIISLYREKPFSSATKYVGFVNGQWDGNDLFWLADAGTTHGFSLARFLITWADRPDVVWITPSHPLTLQSPYLQC